MLSRPLLREAHVFHNKLLLLNKVSKIHICLSVCPFSMCQEVVYVSAKLRLLEHRQQRISEVRAKYQCLKKELEQTKQYLMLEPHKWTTECKCSTDTSGSVFVYERNRQTEDINHLKPQMYSFVFKKTQ